MSVPAGNVLRIGMSNHPAAGWGGSMAVHALGALVASVTFVAVVETQPELIGRQTAAEIELTAAWVELPEPTPAVEFTPAEEQVVVTPDRVHVAERTFFQAGTDVSNPTPLEVAMVERLMAVAAAAKVPHDEVASPSGGAPPQRRLARQSRPAEIAAARASAAPSAPRMASVGTNDQTPPRLLSNRPPTYPEQAILDRLEGTVVLRLQIAADGRVESLEVFRSSGHAILDAAAAGAVRTWQFAPAMRAGQSVAATVRLPVRFSLDRQ